jgi:hypothetical protein
VTVAVSTAVVSTAVVSTASNYNKFHVGIVDVFKQGSTDSLFSSLLVLIPAPLETIPFLVSMGVLFSGCASTVF